MPVVNPLARELVFKIVYYGPGLGGKTTTLQHIHATTRPEHRGKMVSLATPVDRTLYFDFLPIRVPNVRGMGVRLQLFTVPGQVYYNATRKLVLTGADGVVLVVDSQRLRMDASLESLTNLRDNLREHGRSLSEVPFAIQFNKRDLSDVVPIEELQERMNPSGAPSYATVATKGVGVYEALEGIARLVLEDFQRRIPESRALASHQLELPEGGLAEALRRAESDGPLAVTAQVRADVQASPVVPRASALPEELGLSTLPERDPGEDAARAVAEVGRPGDDPIPPVDAGEFADVASQAEQDAAPSTHRSLRPPRVPSTRVPITPPALDDEAALVGPGASFAALWPAGERVAVVELERALASGQRARAVALAEQLVSRVLASTASLLGATPDTPRDPAVVALLLGLDGKRYLEFRGVVRDTRAGGAPTEQEALAAFSFAIDARLLRTRLLG